MNEKLVKKFRVKQKENKSKQDYKKAITINQQKNSRVSELIFGASKFINSDKSTGFIVCVPNIHEMQHNWGSGSHFELKMIQVNECR